MARGGTSEESASSGTAKERGSNLARVMAASFSGGLSIFSRCGVNLAGLSTDLFNNHFLAHLMHFERYSDNKLPVTN